MNSKRLEAPGVFPWMFSCVALIQLPLGIYRMTRPHYNIHWLVVDIMVTLAGIVFGLSPHIRIWLPNNWRMAYYMMLIAHMGLVIFRASQHL